MKKVFRIVLAFVFILAFATSCGSTEGKKKPEATEGKAITEAVTQDSSTEDKSSELITEEKTETKTEAKTEIKTEERTEGETMKEAATLLYQGHASI